MNKLHKIKLALSNAHSSITVLPHNADLLTELVVAHSYCYDLEKELQDVEKVKKDLEEAKAEIAKYKRNISSMLQTLEDTDNMVKDSVKEYDILSLFARNKLRELRALEKDYSELQSENQALVRYNDNLKKELGLSKTHKVIKDLVDGLNNSYKRIKELNEEREQFNIDFKEVMLENKALKEQASKYKLQLSESKETMVKLDKDLKLREEKFTSLYNKFRKTEKELQELKESGVYTVTLKTAMERLNDL